MNTAASSGRRFSSSNVGFSVPIDKALSIVHQIEAGQSDSNVHVGPRALLGVGIQGRSRAAGAAVSTVEPNSPAATAGIVAGDVITSLGSASVASPDELTAAMNTHHPGDKVTVGWIDQSGQSHTAAVQLTSGPPA
jgi:S1-C subfamily serine protease